MEIQIEKDSITQGYSIEHHIGYHDSVKIKVHTEQSEALWLSVTIDGMKYTGALAPAVG